jgi:hypothetical protein
MLKHFATAGVLGVVALMGAVAPAAADKGGHYWFNRTLFPYPYVYNDQSTTTYIAKTPKVQKRYKAGPKLDFETEAVHRNLRPAYFD